MIFFLFQQSLSKKYKYELIEIEPPCKDKFIYYRENDYD